MRAETDPPPLLRFRRAYGRSTAMWSIAGRHDINEHRWLALSGRPSIDFNLALCYADSGEAIADAQAEIKACGEPSVLMLAGPALGHALVLSDSGWVCIGQTAFMRSTVLAPPAQSRDVSYRAETRDLVLAQDSGQLAAARVLFAAAFGSSADDAAIALPHRLLDANGERLWLRYSPDRDLLSCVCTVDVEDLAVIWSMATRPDLQGTGQGRALLDDLHARFSAMSNTRCFLLTSSNAGYPLYLGARYKTLERWQMWSRPRWVIGTR